MQVISLIKNKLEVNLKIKQKLSPTMAHKYMICYHMQVNTNCKEKRQDKSTENMQNKKYQHR